MIRPPPRSTRFPTRRSSDLGDASIRAQGYAVALDELEHGLSAVAAPVLGPGGTAVAALSISGPTIRLTPKRIAELAPELVRQASLLSERLGTHDTRGAA